MRRRRFLLTPDARADLVEIWNYIAEDSVDQADQVLARLHDAFVQLAQSPAIGHHREGLGLLPPPVLGSLFIRRRL